MEKSKGTRFSRLSSWFTTSLRPRRFKFAGTASGVSGTAYLSSVATRRTPTWDSCSAAMLRGRLELQTGGLPRHEWGGMKTYIARRQRDLTRGGRCAHAVMASTSASGSTAAAQKRASTSLPRSSVEAFHSGVST